MPKFVSQQQGVGRQPLFVPRAERWRIRQRLEELSISCGFGENGSLLVEVPDEATAVQIGSVVWQSTAARGELVDWLERCWRS